MILVTAGAGYIGSHVCVELRNAGQELEVFDNFLQQPSRGTGQSSENYWPQAQCCQRLYSRPRRPGGSDSPIKLHCGYSLRCSESSW